MATQEYALAVYSLLARVVTGETRRGDQARLEKLLHTHPSINAELDTLVKAYENNHEEASNDEEVDVHFQNLTRRLQNEGFL